MVRVRINESNPQGYRRAFNKLRTVEFPDGIPENNKFLFVVNKLLASQRKKAWDHEAKEHDGRGKMFFAASLIKTKDGKFYVCANSHLQNSPTSRNCAEANAITEAAQTTTPDELEIAELWVMGGNGDLSKGTYILPDQLGARNAPCGSCLDVIFNSRLSEGNETKVHILPLNDGSWVLESYNDCSMSDIAQKQILTKTISELFPHVTLVMSNSDRSLSNMYRKSLEYIRDKGSLTSITRAFEAGNIDLLATMEKQKTSNHGMLEEINRIMLETIKKEYNESDKPNLKKASIAVIRTQDGKYKIGTYFDDGQTLSMPSAVYNAIQNAGRNKITDVFIMNVDFDKLDEIAKSDPNEILIKMPDGETCDRIRKARPTDESREINYFSQDRYSYNKGPRLHVILPNNITDFSTSKHVIIKNSRELLPFAFSTPKLGCTI